MHSMPLKAEKDLDFTPVNWTVKRDNKFNAWFGEVQARWPDLIAAVVQRQIWDGRRQQRQQRDACQGVAPLQAMRDTSARPSVISQLPMGSQMSGRALAALTRIAARLASFALWHGDRCLKWSLLLAARLMPLGHARLRAARYMF